jgi:hypothetical protein
MLHDIHTKFDKNCLDILKVQCDLIRERESACARARA